MAEGTPAEIKSRVSGRKIRCVTSLTDSFLNQLPSVRSVEHTGAGVTLTVDNAEAVLRTMLAADATMHSLEVSSPALEDAFLELTRTTEAPKEQA